MADNFPYLLEVQIINDDGIPFDVEIIDGKAQLSEKSLPFKQNLIDLLNQAIEDDMRIYLRYRNDQIYFWGHPVFRRYQGDQYLDHILEIISNHAPHARPTGTHNNYFDGGYESDENGIAIVTENIKNG